MDQRLFQKGTTDSYGAFSTSNCNGYRNATGMYFRSGNNRVAPVTETLDSKEIIHSALNVLNLNYTVREWVGPWWKGACFRKRREKIVLRNISLQVRAGEITAILGNSGSGKTSLLDVIACRSSGHVAGLVCFDNIKCTRDVIQERATYVMQADRLLPNLTVRETLRYTACLKLPGDTCDNVLESKVSEVIMQMGLKDIADSRIGSSIIRGISGGEQRRVTIAIQLLKDPDMVLLDEPTSGLDSYTARYLVSNLRDLSRRGKIVLLTIHQPSSDIFHLLDQIGIMSHGLMVYCGPAKDMIPYFTSLGYPCDRYTNPLDRYVDVASIDRRDKESENESKDRVRSLVEAFNNSVFHIQTTQQISICTSRPQSARSNNRCVRHGRPSLLRVMITLLRRMFTNLFRDRKDYFARIFLLPLFMVFILLFLGRLKNTQSGIQDRIGLLYQSATVPPFMGIINSVALFKCLRDLYYREARDGLYGATTFLTAYAIHLVPFHVISSVIFSSTVYWVTGMYPAADRFGLYCLVIFILQFWGEMLCVACMGVFMNANLANGVTALLQAASVVISSGFLRTVASLIKPFQWLGWILIHKYVGEIFVANEFRGLHFGCAINATDCLPNGDLYIENYYPGAADHMTRNFLATGAYALCTTLLAICTFKASGFKNLH